MRLPRLDVVLRLAAGAIDILVNRAAGQPAEAGDDEPRIGALRPGLNASDDALHPVPACGTVMETWNSLNRRSMLPSVTVAARAAVLSSRLRTCLRSVELGATPSVGPTLWSGRSAALRCAIMAVGAQHDFHLRPVAVDRGD
jgi:hypothetical protein